MFLFYQMIYRDNEQDDLSVDYLFLSEVEILFLIKVFDSIKVVLLTNNNVCILLIIYHI